MMSSANDGAGGFDDGVLVGLQKTNTNPLYFKTMTYHAMHKQNSIHKQDK